MKDFMIIGPLGGMGYKEIWPLFRDGEVWIPPERPISPKTGKEYQVGTGIFCFEVSEDYYNSTKHDFNKIRGKDGSYMTSIGACWYYSIPRTTYYSPTLTKTYDPDRYPKLDNYDAIEVKSWPNIPKDYDGTMSLPITYLFVHNPKEYEILDKVMDAKLNGKSLFYRLLIRKLPES